MNDENLENSTSDGSNSPDNTVSCSGYDGSVSPSTGDSEQLSPKETLEQLDSHLKPGVPVEDIEGLSLKRAIELGLMKSEEDYQSDKAKELLEHENYNHREKLDSASRELINSVMESLDAVQDLAQATNKSYAKFIALGMESWAQQLVNTQANIHFNKLVECLQEAKARAMLLNIELGDL